MSVIDLQTEIWYCVLYYNDYFKKILVNKGTVIKSLILKKIIVN